VRTARAPLGHRALLSAVITAAIATAMAEGCGGATAPSSFPEGDGASADGRTCGADAAALSSTLPPGADGGLWTTTYGVDPSCCEPQLLTVISGVADAGIAEGCQYTVQLPCVAAGDVDAGGGCRAWCAAVLGADLYECSVDSTGNGGPVATCTNGSGCGFGRPPRGFVPLRASGKSRVGVQLASMAQLEAASVVAFDALHGDLARAAAPRSLLRSVRAAARDEVRHARVVGRQAIRRGVAVPHAPVARIGHRSPESLAIANAREGCVRETFGAALLAVQSQRAVDPALRALLRRIAGDEVRHAALSWRIAGWLDGQLDARGRRRVARARRRAFDELERELPACLPPDPALGTPGGAEQLRLLAALRATLEAGGRREGRSRETARPGAAP
jgi:hypothetical protein